MKCKEMLLFLTSLFLGVLLYSPASYASSYYIYDYYDTWSDSWSDADKTDDGDDLMCWAAAASNILYWSGWADVDGESFSSSQDIFTYFQDYWTDEGGNVYYAWEWWFEGTSGEYYSNYESRIESDGGGSFWTAEDLDSSFLGTSWALGDIRAIGTLSDLLGNGYGVSLYLTGPSLHAITCWGYETDDRGHIIGVWVTDSDDGYYGMTYYDLNFLDGAWYLFSDTNNTGYSIFGVVGLQMSTLSTVPEPPTMLTFAIGLIGFAGVVRRRQFKKLGGVLLSKVVE